MSIAVGRSFLRTILLTSLLQITGIAFAQNDANETVRADNAQVVDLYRAGNYREASALAERVLKRIEAELGPEHPDTLTSVNNLAFLYETTGRYGEAEPLYRRALEAFERVLGPEHPYTLGSVNNLAGLYETTGRYGEAEPLFRRALEARERVLGPEHPDTLGSVNNLAFLYRTTGRYGEAEPLYRRALEARERVLGPEHPDTLTSVNNLAALYEATGRYGEAEPLYRRALEARERVLGPEHPDTLGSVNNLAGLYETTGRYREAEPLYRRALEARERVLGPEHPDTLGSVNNLAFLYRTTGRYGEAEPLYRRALEARERVLGPEHPDTLTSVNNLAGLYQATGRYGEAEPLYHRTLEAFERKLGPEHPDTLTSVNNLAGLYRATGRYGEAEPLYLRALEASERVLGPEHLDTLGSVNNLAALYRTTGRHGEAEPLYRRALEARERVLGPEHPYTLTSMNNMAALYEATGRYGEAEPLYRRALEARERVLGPEHPQTLSSVNNLAALYQTTGRYGEAESLYRRALEASERVLGPEHPDTLTTLSNFAVLQVRQGHGEAALRGLRKINLRLGQWVGTEVRSTRAAPARRRVLELGSRYQDGAFSLALAHPSAAGNRFAADLTLEWKKRLTQDDAILNNVARETRDPQLLEAVAAVRQGRRALSNIAFDPNVAPEEKTRLREALEVAEAELRARSAIYDRFQRSSSAGSDDVALSLSGDAALVEYRLYDPYDFQEGSFSGPTRLLAVVLRADGNPKLLDLGEAGILTDMQALVGNRDLRMEREISFDEVMTQAHERLIAPLLPYLEGVETLYLAPDGPLQALPFAALVDGEGRRLIETRQVRMLQTGRDLVTRDRPATGKGFVGFGGIDFDAGFKLAAAGATPLADMPDADGGARALERMVDQFKAFSPLGETGAEVTNIAATYDALLPDEPKSQVFTGAAATEAALKGLETPPRVLHLATHGYYLESGTIEGRPLLQSGITLAGANTALGGGTGPDGENGILHAVEAQTLNLYGTELVVLSACDTGKGAADYSEGLEGLPRALYVAGAQNVLVALWPVRDLAARAFMERFYDTWLVQQNSDPAAALRQTQLSYINSPNPADNDPMKWAPFTLIEG